MAETRNHVTGNDLQLVANRVGAFPGAVATNLPAIAPDLQSLIDAWPALPPPIQAAIVAMVKAVGCERGEAAP